MVKEENTIEMRKNFELNADKKTTLQNVKDAVKARLRRCVASNAYSRKVRLKISDLFIYFL